MRWEVKGRGRGVCEHILRTLGRDHTDTHPKTEVAASQVQKTCTGEFQDLWLRIFHGASSIGYKL